MPVLSSTIFPNIIRTVSGTPTLFADDSVLNCDTSGGPVIINLWEIPLDHWNTEWKLHIVDASDNAATNNITINAPAGFKINAAASATINKNGASLIVTIANSTNFIGQSSFIALSDVYTLLFSGPCFGVGSQAQLIILGGLQTPYVGIAPIATTGQYEISIIPNFECLGTGSRFKIAYGISVNGSVIGGDETTGNPFIQYFDIISGNPAGGWVPIASPITTRVFDLIAGDTIQLYASDILSSNNARVVGLVITAKRIG